MKGLIIRSATVQDATALAILVNSAYRGDSSRAGWTTEADLLGGQRIDAERLAETIASPDQVILLNEQEGMPLACVHLRRTGDDCTLAMLTVSPPRQGRGLGRQVLEAAEQWAVEHWQSRSMRMNVLMQRIDLIPWYERRGYRRTGEQKPFPYDDVRFGLPRRPDLRFVVLSKQLRGDTG